MDGTMPEPPASPSDEDIVRAALRDKEAFAEIVRRFENRLGRYLRRLGISRKEDLEDVLQGAFLKAYRNLNDFDPRFRFSSWIYRIAHNEAMSFFRAHASRPEGCLIDDNDDALDALQSDLDVERDVERRLNATRVSDALKTVEPKYRDILILRYLEERDYAEMSDILRIPVGTVGTHLNRAKKRLRAALNHLA